VSGACGSRGWEDLSNQRLQITCTIHTLYTDDRIIVLQGLDYGRGAPYVERLETHLSVMKHIYESQYRLRWYTKLASNEQRHTLARSRRGFDRQISAAGFIEEVADGRR
jgi:hypothetical protein